MAELGTRNVQMVILLSDDKLDARVLRAKDSAGAR
jgi:hypothetical protein